MSRFLWILHRATLCSFGTSKGDRVHFEARRRHITDTAFVVCETVALQQHDPVVANDERRTPEAVLFELPQPRIETCSKFANDRRCVENLRGLDLPGARMSHREHPKHARPRRAPENSRHRQNHHTRATAAWLPSGKCPPGVPHPFDCPLSSGRALCKRALMTGRESPGAQGQTHTSGADVRASDLEHVVLPGHEAVEHRRTATITTRKRSTAGDADG